MSHLQGDIGYATAIELKQGYVRGDVRPTEVVRGVLERIDAVNPKVNAVSEIMGLQQPQGLLGISTNMPATVPPEISKALALNVPLNVRT